MTELTVLDFGTVDCVAEEFKCFLRPSREYEIGGVSWGTLANHISSYTWLHFMEEVLCFTRVQELGNSWGRRRSECVLLLPVAGSPKSGALLREVGRGHGLPRAW